jgi:hypothetical protein
VTGGDIPLFTDEHIDVRLAPALARRGFDAISCQQAGRANQRISDEDQLIYATSQGRVILTFNMVDFITLDAEWKRDGRRHAGIIISAEIRSLTELVQRVEHHLLTISPEQQMDTLLWLISLPDEPPGG